MLLDQTHYLQDNLLHRVDRMSMSHSLEVRPPFLDHRVVEFAARLPERLVEIRGSAQKVVLKRAMRGKLPDALIDRGKAGLDIPALEWFRGPLLPILRDTETETVLRRTNLFDPRATQNLIQGHINRKQNVGYQLWGLLTLLIWLRRWNVEVTSASGNRFSEQAELAAAS